MRNHSGDEFYRKADGAEIDVRRDRFDGFQVTIVRGSSFKHIHLSREQAAAVRDGLIATLGETL